MPFPDAQEAYPTTCARLLGLLLFLLVSLSFLPSLSFSFLDWDDQLYITNNPWLWNPTPGSIARLFVSSYSANYHPLTLLSYMVDYHVFGLWPGGYRLVNILWHAGTCWVLFSLLRRASGRPLVAFLLGAWFGLHPLRTESVVWISERKDVLCGFFYLSAVACWMQFEEGKARWGVGAAACGVFAALGKSMAISLPPVFLVLDLVLRRRLGGRRVAAHALLFAAAVAIAVINMKSQTEARSPEARGLDNLGVAFAAPIFLLEKTLVPAGLCALHPYDHRPPILGAMTLAGVAVALALLGVVLITFRRRPHACAFLLAAGIAYAPVSGIVRFGYAWVAERYSYLPTALLLVGLASLLRERRSAAVATAVLLPSVAAYAFVMSVQLPWWRDSVSLWERAVAVYPDSTELRERLANAAGGRRRAGELQALVETLHEDYTRIAPESAVRTLTNSGDLAGAERVLQGLRETRPESALVQLAGLYNQQGRKMEAIAAASELARVSTATSMRARAAFELAWAGDIAAARSVLHEVRVPTADGAAAWGVIAVGALKAGDPSGAREAANRALAIDPASRDGVSVAGFLAFQSGNWAGLDELARRALSSASCKPETRAATLVLMAQAAESRGADPGDLYVRAREADVRSVDALVGRALQVARRGDRVPARAMLARALNARPGDPQLQRLVEALAGEK